MNHDVRQFSEWYGNGTDGSAPTPTQWARALSLPADQSLTLINFFRLREFARNLPDLSGDLSGNSSSGTAISGKEAFSRYTAVSIPTMERVGGSFLFVGPFTGMFLGEEEDWDLVAIGSYPNLDSFRALYSDAEYRKAFAYRTAACDRQKVLITGS